MSVETRISLTAAAFSDRAQLLVDAGELTATAFRYQSGVAGLTLENDLGQLTMLPFHGQQIWSASFSGRELCMRSMFDAPRATRNYLENYGALLMHCGVTAMGPPGPQDTHPLHGELPHAPYSHAKLVLGEDERGRYIGLTGTYQHTVAFACNYLAQPLVKLYQGSSVFWVSIRVQNLKRSEMELMYLSHINLRPADHARIVYSAPPTPERVRVRTSIPGHIQPKEGYRELIDTLAKHPDKHHTLEPELVFDPEAVFEIDYQADDTGFAHSLQIHTEGHADYVAHRPAELPVGIRWISRTPDQDALGLVLPATAGVEGYHEEKAKGRIKILPPEGTFFTEYAVGTLPPDETNRLETHIQHILTP